MQPFAFERDIVKQIRIHVLPTNRFKTFAIALFLGSPLTERDVTATALLPHVLRRGNSKFPETKAFREKLDDLYGAGFGFEIFKRGDVQIVQFRMDVVSDAFVADGGSLLAEALEFLGTTVCDPALEGRSFIPKYVQAEKTTLKNRLDALINDKIRYAGERCIEEMFAGEPFRLNALGRTADLPALEAQTLYEQYKSWLERASLDLYVVGNTTLAEVGALVERHFCLSKTTPADYAANPARLARSEIKTVVERLEITQGKLNLGLVTGITYRDDAYAAALMYNGVLGAYPHSKLFANVREKASLAYYAASRLDAHKGIMSIFSGIEIANYERALDIIRKQLAAMEQGKISETEITQTRAMLKNALQEIYDSAYEMISFDFNGLIAKRERTVPKLLAQLAEVSAADIQAVARQVRLDTVYFLRDNQEEGGERDGNSSL